MKNFMKMVLYGSAVYLGYKITDKTIDTLSNPYKKKQIKKRIVNVKNAFTGEVES